MMRSSILFISLLALLAGGCVNIPPGLFGPRRGTPELETIRSSDGLFNRSQVLVIDLAGIVNGAGQSGGFGSSVGMLVELKDKLKQAEGNSRIKAVVLKINSPGGGVTASDLIHQELLAFKERTALPVIALMEDVAASGGVYIAMAADEIYALPTTITGSIGVIASWPGLKDLSDKVGLEMRVFKSADKKDIGSPWRDMTEAEKELMQGMIDQMFERFVTVVLDSRKDKGLTREALLTFADGRVFDGPSAVEHKLIDGVQYIDEVLDRAMVLGDCPGAAVVSYEYPNGYRGNIYAVNQPVQPGMHLGAKEINLIKLPGDPGSLEPGFHYRWVR